MLYHNIVTLTLGEMKRARVGGVIGTTLARLNGSSGLAAEADNFHIAGQPYLFGQDDAEGGLRQRNIGGLL